MKRARKKRLFSKPSEGMLPVIITGLLMIGIVLVAGYGLRAMTP